MTQPAVAVGGDTPAEPTNADAFTQLAAEEFGIPEEDEPVEGEPTDELTEDETEIEEEADDLPPIDAPVSLSAEDKETFASLPRPAQEILSKRIGEAEKGLHQATQKAARARQEVEQEAHQQIAAYERQVSERLQQYAQQFDVPQPDMALLATDPTAYAYQAKQYQDAQAQRSQAQQQAQYYAQQAQQREAHAEQAQLAEQHKIIVDNFPEYADPTTGPELQRKLSAVAKRIGYPDELISQARATDIIAMKKVADAFDKADKYDGLMSKKMEGVRAARGLPRVATPGVTQGSEQLRANRATASFEIARTAKNRDVAGQAFYDGLISSGLMKK